MKKTRIFWLIFLGMLALSVSIEPNSRLGFAASSAVGPQALSQPALSCSGSSSCSGNNESSPPPADTTPPDTTITIKPLEISSFVADEFQFTASEPAASFECSLDSEGFTPCTSPQSYVALYEGTHSFAVRAKDQAGNLDPTPATFSWTVKYAWRTETVVAAEYSFQQWNPNHALVLDGSGNIHLVYGSDHLAYTYFDGSEWHTETADNSRGVGGYTSLALDSSGKAHISYYDSLTKNLKYATNKIGSWTSTNLGYFDWSTPQSSIAVDSSGSVHVVYCSSGSMGYLNNSSGSPGDWMWEPSPPNNCQDSPYLIIEGNDTLHLSFRDWNSVYYAKKTGWGTWNVETVDSDCRNFSDSDLDAFTLDPDGKVHIGYGCNSGTLPEGTLRYATNSSGAWVSTNIYQFDPFSIFRFRTSIARDDLGAIHILFIEGV
ncbi:MAG: hypothetical protein PHE84_09900, partial [bacterium]|nr:hypothetical protein [bacterium]